MVFEVLVALVVALGSVLVLGWIVGVRLPAPVWALFLVLFLLVWAGGVWLSPLGPPLTDLWWLPFGVMGIVVTLLFASMLTEPGASGEGTRQGTPESHSRVAALREAAHLSVFWWALAIFLVLLIVLAYLRA